MKQWQQLALRMPGPQAELVQALLEEQGCLSVTWLDAQDQPLLEPEPGEQPVWDAVVLKGLFEADADLRPLQALLEQQAEVEWLGVEQLQDQVWERAWMDQFRPMRFGQRLWIVPSSHATPDEAEVVLHLDPGLAFGTGTHATTALCLQWLDAHPPEGLQILDYGCGSGILALAALLLGAEQALGVDIDPQALEASAENARRNGLQQRLQLCLPQQTPDKTWPLVLANILAAPLCEMAESLSARVAHGGTLVLSGILAEQADRVREAYVPHLTFQQQAQQDDWVRLVFTRT